MPIQKYLVPSSSILTSVRIRFSCVCVVIVPHGRGPQRLALCSHPCRVGVALWKRIRGGRLTYGHMFLMLEKESLNSRNALCQVEYNLCNVVLHALLSRSFDVALFVHPSSCPYYVRE